MLNWFAFFPLSLKISFIYIQIDTIETCGIQFICKVIENVAGANMGKWEPNRLTIGIFPLVAFTFFLLIYACIFVDLSTSFSTQRNANEEKRLKQEF